jgi:hypothetical protein
MGDTVTQSSAKYSRNNTRQLIDRPSSPISQFEKRNSFLMNQSSKKSSKSISKSKKSGLTNKSKRITSLSGYRAKSSYQPSKFSKIVGSGNEKIETRSSLRSTTPVKYTNDDISYYTHSNLMNNRRGKRDFKKKVKKVIIGENKEEKLAQLGDLVKGLTILVESQQEGRGLEPC